MADNRNVGFGGIAKVRPRDTLDYPMRIRIWQFDARRPWLGFLAALLVATLFALVAPPHAQSQTASASAPTKTSSEGDRLLTAGVKAYQQGQMAEASRLWEQARTIYSRELGEDHPNTLGSMNNLAATYGALGQHDKALALKEQTLKLRRAKLGDDHPDTLTSMNNLANTYGDLGQHDKALALKEQTLKLRRAKLGDDHPNTLASMNNLAATYGDLGQHDKALALMEQTLKLMRAKLGDDHPNTLASMNNLAITYGDLGQHDKALALKEQTLKLRRAKLGDDHPDTLASMNNLAATYGDLGQHDKALALKEQTLKLRRAKLGDDHPDTLASMNNLAATYGDLGQHDKALALMEQTLKLRRAKLGDDHPDTLASMNNLAATYGDLGQHDKALALKEQTLKLRRAKLGEDHPNTLGSMNNLAATYGDLGQHDKALALKEQTLKLRRAKLGDDHPNTLASMNNLANTYGALGQHDKALALMEQTLKLRRAKLGEDHPNTLASMNNLANTYGALGQHDKALALKEQTLKLRRAKLGEDHPNTLGSMNNLAATYGDLGQHDKALALIPPIISGAEKLRALPGLATEQRQSLFSEYSDRYQWYSEQYGRARRFDEAFNLGDLSKARTLTDSIKAQLALRSLPIAEQQTLQSSETRIQPLQKLIDALSTKGTRDSGALLALQKQLDAHRTDHAQLLSRLHGQYPKYARLASLKPATADQAKQLLGAGEVFVSYLIRTTGTAQAFVLDASGDPRWVDLGQIRNHARTVEAYRELLQGAGDSPGQLVALKDGGYQWIVQGGAVPEGAKPVATDNLAVAPAPTSSPGPPNASRVEDALRLLERYWHDTLIKPILPLAGAYPRWIVSPDKDLALLPFDTLAESFDAAGKAQPLVRTRNLTLVQSFAVFALLKQREAEYATLKRPKDLFAMGNPVYADGWAENRGMRRGGARGFAENGASATRANALANLPPAAEQEAMRHLAWMNLPGTAREIAAVREAFAGSAGGSDPLSKLIGAASRLLGGEAPVDAYQGPEASEGKLRQLNGEGRLKDYRYLLFSAHGYLARNPGLSSLVLSRQGNPPEIDGYVTAEEWPFYDMRSDLTVLSACDTGVGKTQAGESVMGLPYALFVAGNKNTLLSLWPVDDDATAEFMRRFFTRLRAGTSQPDALRQTKQEFARHPQWNAPRFWAPFVLYGV